LDDKNNDGGPAFPHPVPRDAWGVEATGMSLRDYFAALALPGVIAAAPNAQRIAWVTEAYCIADEMLKARK